jgi:dihydrofolate reductase
MRYPNLTLLAAADANWGIGLDGGLPWRCPEDLRNFKTRTMGKTVFMGRWTFETLPSTLPGRTIVVLSRSPPPGSSLITLETALGYVADIKHEEFIVAGGAAVYEAALPYCAKAEITRIAGEYECDTRMADLEAAGWTKTSESRLSDIATVEEWRPS